MPYRIGDLKGDPNLGNYPYDILLETRAKEKMPLTNHQTNSKGLVMTPEYYNYKPNQTQQPKPETQKKTAQTLNEIYNPPTQLEATQALNPQKRPRAGEKLVQEPITPSKSTKFNIRINKTSTRPHTTHKHLNSKPQTLKSTQIQNPKS